MKGLIKKLNMKIKERLIKWWYLTMKNPTVRVGEKGGFKWSFKRFSMDIETLSGNFKASFTAAEHPYGYLISGKNDDNIEGFCQMLYTLGMLLTTDQGLVDDVTKAIRKYEKRLGQVKQDDDNEEAALEEVKSVQEHIELPEKERKRVEKNIDARFKKNLKDIKKKES